MPDLTPTQIEYKKYLQTSHWKEKRLERLAFAGHRCELCNAPGGLDVHHRTYERRGAELLTDLIALCQRCHQSFHRPEPEERERPQPPRKIKHKRRFRLPTDHPQHLINKTEAMRRLTNEEPVDAKILGTCATKAMEEMVKAGSARRTYLIGFGFAYVHT